MIKLLILLMTLCSSVAWGELPDFSKSIFLLRGPLSGGTGFVTEYAGTRVLVTNRHVCAFHKQGKLQATNADHIGVHTIIGYAADFDLCVLDANDITSPSLPLALEDNLNDKIGDTRAYVVGHPKLGPLTVYEGTSLSYELVPLAYGDMDGIADPDMVKPKPFDNDFLELYIVKSLVISMTGLVGGVSGSPVLNSAGEVIGVIYGCSPDDGVAVQLTQLREFLIFISAQLKLRQQESPPGA